MYLGVRVKGVVWLPRAGELKNPAMVCVVSFKHANFFD